MNKPFWTILVLFLASSALSFDVIHAGPGRTGQTRQGQTRQETLQLGRIAAKQAQHFQRLTSPQTDRFERRHFHWQATPSNSSKVLLFTLATLMLIAPTVTAFADKPSVDKSSPIYSKPYRAGIETATLGPCTTFSNNSTFCCGIGSNYTVECCVHPDPSTVQTSKGISRCLSYNLDGIVGDQPTAPLNLTAALLETKKHALKHII